MPETAPSITSRIVAQNADRYIAELEAKAKGEVLPPPDKKEFTPLLDHMTGPLLNGISLGNREPNAVEAVRGALDTVEPDLQDAFLSGWSHVVADRSYPLYEADDVAMEMRQEKVDATAKELQEWLKRSKARIDSWKDCEHGLELLIEECEQRFAKNPPKNQADVDRIMAEVNAWLVAEEKAADLKTYPSGQVEPVNIIYEDMARHWYENHKTLDALGLAQEFKQLEDTHGLGYAEEVLRAYFRYVADTRILYPVMLFQYGNLHVDTRKFNAESALKKRAYQILHKTYGAYLQDEIKDVARYTQHLTTSNREYADEVRAALREEEMERDRERFKANVMKKVA